MELWLHGFSFPGRVAELARDAEDWGFTGLLIADSQNLTADVWVELAAVRKSIELFASDVLPLLARNGS